MRKTAEEISKFQILLKLFTKALLFNVLLNFLQRNILIIRCTTGAFYNGVSSEKITIFQIVN